MTPGLGTVIDGRDLAVDPSRVDDALRSLWREEAKGTPGVIRAALWNVIAFARDERERGKAGEILATLGATIPQRTLLISAVDRGGPELSVWIGANCRLLDGEKQLCSEEITIAAKGERVAHVGSIVRALLVPDLPVALWWTGSDPEDVPDDLLESSDFLIYDSRRFTGPEDLASALSRLRERSGGGADLQWKRISEWRRATAAAFDCAAVRSQRILRLRVRFAGSPEGRWGESAGAWLYAGWLAAQLGLAVGPHGIPLRVEPESADGAGRLMSVMIGLEGGSEVRVERHGGAVRAWVRGLDAAPPAIAALRSGDLIDLVRRALARRDRSRVHERALERAATLARRQS